MSMLIGITGGIGSGKSAVSSYLESKGEIVLCADKMARQVVRPGEAGNVAVRDAFGDAYFFKDGTLNRKKLASDVFSDSVKLKQLNNMLHPIIITEMFKKASSINRRIFMDVALLIQSGMHRKMDFVWLVTADIETRIARVMKRDNATYEQVKLRMKQQMSDEDMKKYADEVIDNSKTLSDLNHQIESILKKETYYNEVNI